MITKPDSVIETWHQSILFRSRMEARWAVFLDEMDVSFSYEQEGFNLGELGGYRPDFWMPSVGKWMEYKPVRPTEVEFEKGRRVAALTGHPFVFFYGSMDSPDYRKKNRENGIQIKPSGEEETQYWWCHCPKCGLVGLEYWGNASRMRCGCGFFKPDDLLDNIDGKHHQFNTDRLVKAYMLARNYQFWEKPPVDYDKETPRNNGTKT